MKKIIDKIDKIIFEVAMRSNESKYPIWLDPYSDKILSLFDQTVKELVGKDFKTVTGWSFDGCGGCGECGQQIGYDRLRSEILKKWEQLKK